MGLLTLAPFPLMFDRVLISGGAPARPAAIEYSFVTALLGTHPRLQSLKP
jgi:hypothetical protein